MKYLQIIFFLFLFVSCLEKDDISSRLPISRGDLHFEGLAQSWDEGIPLGNGMLGALIWQKEGKLRISLDRADLWDLRPMANLDVPEWKFKWVYEQWKNNTYKEVQDRFDAPYNKLPAPTKIPGAALEIDISDLGEVEYVHLYVKNAVCEIKWKNGVRFLSYVHAVEPVGWFRFEGLDNLPKVKLMPPPYDASGVDNENANSLEGHDLRRLGYESGTITETERGINYIQPGWGDFKYRVDVRRAGTNEVSWTISTGSKEMEIENRSGLNFEKGYVSHLEWWSDYWSKSSVALPDPVLQKQWMLEMYKFGSAARKGAPPISLQAVWTADNGQIPPWKGDFHHDLNTQLSYWPAYSGNHLEEAEGFVDWLWENKPIFKSYTKSYYETDGLNVPGVSTLRGEPMGGWIQYSFGPTVSAWLAHHFYLHWRYSGDRDFLRDRAYPWIREVAVHLDQLSVPGAGDYKKLPISSSPEIHDNSREAWFDQTTNFDLALIKWTLGKAAELALELALEEEASRWESKLREWPELATDPVTGLKFAPDEAYEESHRHFSHLMAFHPLGDIDYSNGKRDQEIINNTVSNLEVIGTDWWTGYSFAWMGNLKARAFDGEGAADYLRKFATSFCLPNSFHVNGDQSGKGFSRFTYRPFTLEGNFAFAAGVNEMLLQSHSGIIHVFSAIPPDWTNVSFEQLRAEGAFLVSAKREKGQVTFVRIISDKGGGLVMKNPFTANFKANADFDLAGDHITAIMNPGDVVEFSLK